MMEDRLDKLLSTHFGLSRNEARAAIHAGRVTVDGQITRNIGAKTFVEQVTLDNIPARAVPAVIMLHKPAGVLSASWDREQKTVMDLLPPRLQNVGLFPVGRLDKDATGLLLLARDGDLAHRLTSPRRHVPKVYRVTVNGTLTPSDIRMLAEGLTLSDGTICLSAELEILAPDTGLLTLYEGKYHQAKRMFAALSKPIQTLHRERFGPLALDPALQPGAWREVTPTELAALSSI